MKVGDNASQMAKQAVDAITEFMRNDDEAGREERANTLARALVEGVVTFMECTEGRTIVEFVLDHGRIKEHFKHVKGGANRLGRLAEAEPTAGPIDP